MDDRSESLVELTKALAKAQSQLKGAARDARNPHLNSRYADLSSVWDACREALTSNGLAVVQAPQVTEAGYLLKTTLTHVSGEWIASTFPLLIDANARSTMQALGSAISYARRYALSSMVGVVPAEDDDGEAAGVHAPAERGQWSNKPARQERQQADGKDYGPPKTGRQFFAWIKSEEAKGATGLLKRVNDWGRREGIKEAIVSWPDEVVADAYQLASMALASEPAREREPGEEG